MKNYCPDLFRNLFVYKLNESAVELGHCCISDRSAATDKISFDNEFLEQGRNHFLTTGELPNSCRQCKDLESIGSTSKRTQSQIKEKITTNQLDWLQYNCDNICNLKCIMCSSYSSSAWIEDEIKLGFKPKIKIKPTKYNPVFFNFNVDSLQSIYFNGGEPLMTNDHLRVLSHLHQTIDTKNTNVLYNTNATFNISDDVLDIWKKFNKVTLIASIDAIEDQFEYIRYPANWSNVLQNLYSYRDAGIDVSVGVNIGVHNIMYFGDLYNWALNNNFQFNFQSDTIGDLSLRNFPKHLVQYAQDYLQKQIDSDPKTILLNTLDNLSDNNITWVSWLNSLDRIRGNSWKHSLSRLYELDTKFFNNFK